MREPAPPSPGHEGLEGHYDSRQPLVLPAPGNAKPTLLPPPPKYPSPAYTTPTFTTLRQLHHISRVYLERRRRQATDTIHWALPPSVPQTYFPVTLWYPGFNILTPLPYILPYFQLYQTFRERSAALPPQPQFRLHRPTVFRPDFHILTTPVAASIHDIVAGLDGPALSPTEELQLLAVTQEDILQCFLDSQMRELANINELNLTFRS